jgi:hypothetical protein
LLDTTVVDATIGPLIRGRSDNHVAPLSRDTAGNSVKDRSGAVGSPRCQMSGGGAGGDRDVPGRGFRCGWLVMANFSWRDSPRRRAYLIGVVSRVVPNIGNVTTRWHSGRSSPLVLAAPVRFNARLKEAKEMP